MDVQELSNERLQRFRACYLNREAVIRRPCLDLISGRHSCSESAPITLAGGRGHQYQRGQSFSDQKENNHGTLGALRIQLLVGRHTDRHELYGNEP